MPVPLETSGIVLYYVSVSPLELSVAGCVQKYMVHRHHAKHNTSLLFAIATNTALVFYMLSKQSNHSLGIVTAICLRGLSEHGNCFNTVSAVHAFF